MSRAWHIDWPLCFRQASLMAVMHIIFSTTDALRLTSDGPTLWELASALAIALPNWFPLGLILAAGAQCFYESAGCGRDTGILAIKSL